jgi:HK97 family phage major capsid protein
MTMPTPPGVVQSPWPAAFGADFQGRVLGLIVEGSPFSRTCTPLPTSRSAIAFGLLDLEDPAWGGELSQVPDLSKDQDQYQVGVSRLSGSILVSNESIDDAEFPLTRSVSQTLTDTFSHKLDRDLIGAAGPMPTPAGILSVAAQMTAADWHLAAIAGKAAMATAGGAATHFCASPAVLGEIESARDDLGRQLYPDVAQSFAGLATISAVGATQPFIFAKDRCWLVINKDFTVDVSRETTSAWDHYATSLRVVARFGLAVPQPSRAARKLAITPPASASRKS